MFRRKREDTPVKNFQRVTPPPWPYVSEGPYHVIVMCEKDPVANYRINRLDNAIAWYARFNLPMIRPRTAAIVDKHLQMILCYDAEIDGTVTWGGTAEVFDVLERFYDPGEVLVWRTEASGGIQI